jgi:PEP-CTERM motif
MKTTPRNASVVKLAIFLGCASIADAQLSTAWITQFGSGGDDVARAIAVDSTGQSWLAGFTYGNLSGASAGAADVFLSRVSSGGIITSTNQRGSTVDERSYGIALLGNSAVFTGGFTNGPLDGQTSLGSGDNAILRYSTAGIWQSTLLTGSSTQEAINGLAANATNLFSAGDGNGGAYITKGDATGTPIWSGFVSDAVNYCVALDTAGNSYLAGYISGAVPGGVNAGGSDIFFAKYDPNGNQTLIKQRGTSAFETAHSIKVDLSGNIYIAGETAGNLDGQTNGGSGDGFLTKLDSAGNLLWTRLIGGSAPDIAWALDLDSSGNLWVGGYSDSNLGTHTNAGGHDAFVAKYDSNGNLLGTDFLATSADEILFGVSVAPGGGVVVTGYTNGNLGGTNAGAGDIFVAKIVPEPTTAVSLLLGLGVLAVRRNRRWLRRIQP